MIDPTTLPRFEANVVIPAGTIFEVKGLNYNLWPQDVVLSFNTSYALEEETPSVRVLREISRTNTSMLFVVDIPPSFSTPHTFTVFAAPRNIPREILQYTTMS